MRIPLAGSVPAGHEVLLVAQDAVPFALCGAWAGGGAIVGSEPVRVAGADEDPFAVLASAAALGRAEGEAVGGGWFGWIGYAGGGTERERLPRFALARYDHVLRLDPEGRWWFEALPEPGREAAVRARLEALGARLAAGVRPPRPVATAPWRSAPGPAGHRLAVAAARERIVAGDLLQANVSVRLRSRLTGAPAELFARAAAELRPERAAFVAGPWGAVASLSPELFLARRGRRVRSAPIKGTRPRPGDPIAAAASRAELVASAKDRAENVMIVDLVRNDLGRVCATGSVRVAALAEVRPAPGVWHLVSEVEGELREDAGDEDLLRAAFPPGSVTGAPKLAAMDAIAELESAARQVFTGAIGFASPAAGLELSVAIRTFETTGEDIWLDAGGGIVADSEPEAEGEEALAKARPLLAAIGGRLADGPTASAAPPVLRLGPRPLPRPDPAAGVFSTLLVREGRAEALEEHVARLAASLRALYGTAPPEDLRARIGAAARAAEGPCRLRLDLDPSGAAALITSALPGTSAPVVLAPVTVPGGLGAHKWRDRRALDALAAAVAPAVPLLVDLDGEVLEIAWGNVLAEDAAGGLRTPALDGRILPGVARASLLAAARASGRGAEEGRLELCELAGAARILVTSALRGPVPASLAG